MIEWRRKGAIFLPIILNSTILPKKDALFVLEI